MGPGIIIPLVLLAVAVPIAFTFAKRYLKEGGSNPVGEVVVTPSARLTSNALRDLPAPPWRVVYEIADDKLDGLGHVLIGPAGIFAMQTSMDPMPAPIPDPDAHAVARAAIARGGLDDALRRCAMSSDRLVTVHWGGRTEDAPIAVETLPGSTAVDGRALVTWASGLSGDLTPTQVDLAWQTVTTAIGRPDPLP